MKNVLVAVTIFILLAIIAFFLIEGFKAELNASRQLQLNILRSRPMSKVDIEQTILVVADRYEINGKRFLEVARCESSLRPNVCGDGGDSCGLFQIHLKSHPDVTKEQALNPFWAIEWAAKKFLENPKIWTCYRNLYGRT